MLTPAMSLEEGRTRSVTSWVHPPSSTRFFTRSKEYQIGTTSPWSVGGGVLEFGFKSSRDLFSGPGSLEEWSCSAFCVLALSCALAVRPAKAAVARATELMPRKLLRDGCSLIGLFFECLIIFFYLSFFDCGSVGR